LYEKQNYNYLVQAACQEYHAGQSSGECPATTKINWMDSLGSSSMISISLGEGKYPESLKIEGDLLVILLKEGTQSYEEAGKYTTKKQDDASLLNDEYIIEKRPCLDASKNYICPVSKAEKMLIIPYTTDITTEE